ncbi:filamentous hemagglutinin N-terminal domain-containing protein [Amphibiibacter pelophylacis]|uniref:Filamentous hemagglutinin N-terminal domain-containing protein n=1 Tax=Amphibiibacter pelophylacis TaxID=1799477 RepID=A0ACC6P2P2_9BURK
MKTQKKSNAFTASRLAQALSVSGLMAASLAHAQALTPAYGSGVEITRQNNVPVIQIVKPTPKGLSHNRFTDYNTGTEGVIVNNARTAVATNIAGTVQANPNLAAGTAKVILNEVVSGNPSTIAGRHEIAGDRAALVIANPNGITANGAGFINTSRATLAAGRAEVVDGALKSIVTDQGAVLRANGVGNAGGEQLDLMASHVLVAPGSKLEGGMMLNVIGGSTKTDYDKSARANYDAGSSVAVNPAKPFAQTNGLKEYDVSILGSAEAGRINIVSNHVNRGTFIQGASLKATDGDLSINGHGGRVEVGAKVEKHVYEDKTSDDSWWNWGAAGWEWSGGHRWVWNEFITTSGLEAKGNVNISGGVMNLDAAQIKGKNVAIAGDTLSLGAVNTTNLSDVYQANSLHFWNKQVTTYSKKVTPNVTNIVASEDASIVANTANLSGTTVKADGKARLEGRTTLNVGVAEGLVDDHNSTVENNRTIINRSDSGTYVYDTTVSQSSINGAKGLGITGGTVKLNAVTASTGGDAVINASESLRVGETKFETSRDAHDFYSNTNGAFGGYSRSDNGKISNVLGSNINAGGEMFLTANKGVDVVASIVKATGGVYGDGGAGDVRVDVSTGQQLRNLTDHNWTVFGIVTKDDNSQLQKDLVKGSVVHSDADINLLTKADVRVIGSLLEAADNLNISADGVVAIEAAKERTQAGTQKLWWTAGTSSSTDANGNTTVSASLKQHQERTTLDQSLAKSANLTAGGAINITAGRNIGVVGSNLTAGKDVNLVGENVSVTAANETKKTTQFKQEAGITFWATGGPDTVGLGINIGVDRTNTATDATTPKSSTITAGGDVNRAATGEAGTAASNAAFAKDAIGLNAQTATGKTPASGTVNDVGTQITAGGAVTNAGQATTAMAATGSSTSTSISGKMNLTLSTKLGDFTVVTPDVTRSSSTSTTSTSSSTPASTAASQGVINVTQGVRRKVSTPAGTPPSLVFTGAQLVAQ